MDAEAVTFRVIILNEKLHSQFWNSLLFSLVLITLGPPVGRLEVITSVNNNVRVSVGRTGHPSRRRGARLRAGLIFSLMPCMHDPHLAASLSYTLPC